MRAGIQTLEAQNRSLSPVSGMALDHPTGSREELRRKLVCQEFCVRSGFSIFCRTPQAHAGALKYMRTHPRTDAP